MDLIKVIGLTISAIAEFSKISNKPIEELSEIKATVESLNFRMKETPENQEFLISLPSYIKEQIKANLKETDNLIRGATELELNSKKSIIGKMNKAMKTNVAPILFSNTLIENLKKKNESLNNLINQLNMYAQQQNSGSIARRLSQLEVIRNDEKIQSGLGKKIKSCENIKEELAMDPTLVSMEGDEMGPTGI